MTLDELAKEPGFEFLAQMLKAIDECQSMEELIQRKDEIIDKAMERSNDQ